MTDPLKFKEPTMHLIPDHLTMAEAEQIAHNFVVEKIQKLLKVEFGFEERSFTLEEFSTDFRKEAREELVTFQLKRATGKIITGSRDYSLRRWRGNTTYWNDNTTLDFVIKLKNRYNFYAVFTSPAHLPTESRIKIPRFSLRVTLPIIEESPCI